MSLRSAAELLKLAKETFKIKEGGPMSQGNHSLTYIEGKLVLSLNTGFGFNQFTLDDAELDEEPSVIIEKIRQYLEKQTVFVS